jgi:uncharacterized protein DUF3857
MPGAASAQNAPARIRVQTDQVDVQANGICVETLHTELQVLTTAAVTQLAQTPIGYIESMQDVDVLEAYTRKADGRKINVEASGIVTRQPPATAARGHPRRTVQLRSVPDSLLRGQARDTDRCRRRKEQFGGFHGPLQSGLYARSAVILELGSESN